jgi:eukaryotic-like serine/threonine-protein kinase
VVGGPAGRRAAPPTQDPPTGEMTVKLTDFGIARAAEQTRLTQVGSVVGTAAYLAPEQARGEEATPASDVYALGVVIYQLLTGRLPWEGTSLAELAIRRENERPLAPSSYDSEVPETLSTAVLRSLEGDPQLRYTTARELAAALRAGLTGTEPPLPDSEAATRAMTGTPTESTRRLPVDEPATAPTRHAPAPRPAPRARPAPPAPAAAPKRKSRLPRILGMLLVIAILAAIIAAIVLVTTNAGQNTEPGELIRDTVNDQIQSIEDFIRDHTQQ